MGIDANSTNRGIFSLGSSAPSRSDRASFSMGVNNVNLDDEPVKPARQSVRMMSLLDDILDGKGGGDSGDEILVPKKRNSIGGKDSKDSLVSASANGNSTPKEASTSASTAVESSGPPGQPTATDKELEERKTLEKDIDSINELSIITESTHIQTVDDTLIINNNVQSHNENGHHDVISADDFLPLFTYVLVQAGLPQLLLVKELMLTLVDDEDTYGECGYYLATLEAASQHICDLAEQYEKVANIETMFTEEEDVFEYFDKKA